MKKAKKNNPSTNNNKKEAGTKSKQALNKSVERRKKGGLNLTTESKNLVFEDKNVKDKINIEKPTKHDREEKKSSSVSNRTNKATKTKDYNNNTNN